MISALPKLAQTPYYGSLVNWQHPANRGLVAWWLNLPQLRGGVALRDIVGGYNVTLTNGAQWAGGLRPGGYGCLEFDGTNDNAVTPATRATFSDATRGMSFACVVQRRTTGVSTYLWGQRARYAFYFLSTNVLRITFFGVADVGSTGSVTDTGWHHVAFTMDSAGAVAFYIDGKSAGTGTMSGDGSSGSANAMEMGGWISDGVYSNQRQDDCRFYRRALTAGEVSELYRQSLLGNPSTLNWRSHSWSLGQPGAAAGGPSPFFVRPRMSGGMVGG